MEQFKGWRQFLELVLSLKKKDELEQIFDLFLTIEEKQLLAQRYLIIKELLDEKISQREIAKEHQVSIAQITRGSNALKRINPKVKHFLKTKL